MRIDRHYGQQGIGAGTSRPFLLGVLMAMTTALLCALLPAGSPSSSAVGSAFSPATIQVSLNAPATRMVKRAMIDARRAGGDHPIPSHDGPAPSAAQAVFAPPASPASAPAYPALAAIQTSGAPIGAAWPRGPPAA